ncbi:MAG: ECF transporter S component [Eubacteriales bacterium]|nr:ECF transporter S component [Eubacteriales bacterium]
MTQKNHTKTLIVSSILAALIFVFTYLVRIPVTNTGAYMNIGDCIIYCAGMLVGAPWAAAASGIGSMFADILVGGGIYIPATLVIKALMGFVCAILMKNAKLPKFVLACILGGAIMVVGYGLFEWFAFGWSYAISTIVFNLIQWVVGVAGAAVLYYPVKRIKGTI